MPRLLFALPQCPSPLRHRRLGYVSNRAYAALLAGDPDERKLAGT
jgi:hypothetical protein